MMSARLRASGLVLVTVSALVVACSGGSDDSTFSSTSSSSGTSGGGRRPGGWPPVDGGGVSSSSGYVSPGYETPPSRPPNTIPYGDIRSITVGHDVCGKAPGTCMDAQSFTVDFVTSTRTHTTCVEIASADAGPFGGTTTDATETTSLTKSQLQAVRQALENVIISSAGFDGWDGPIDTLEVTAADGTSRFYSPAAGCSKDKFTKIEKGFEDLWKVVVDSP